MTWAGYAAQNLAEDIFRPITHLEGDNGHHALLPSTRLSNLNLHLSGFSGHGQVFPLLTDKRKEEKDTLTHGLLNNVFG